MNVCTRYFRASDDSVLIDLLNSWTQGETVKAISDRARIIDSKQHDKVSYDRVCYTVTKYRYKNRHAVQLTMHTMVTAE
jgi:hypothetical protein